MIKEEIEAVIELTGFLFGMVGMGIFACMLVMLL